LLDCGIDILNPIQPGVEKMEPERLKLAYGDVLAFWGGVDTQKLLPGASPQEVKQAVKKLLSVLDVNGGYILAPAHTIQHDVPAENIIAMYQGAKEYYGQ
jgi:uroporphyrinogen decarboxylase